MRSFVILLGIVTTAHAAPTVEVVAAPPIAAAPDSGLDPDVAARLAAAERDPDLAHALDEVLVTYESNDPFSRAQRDAARSRTLAILTQIGERAKAAGDVVLAARAFDARWTIDGKRDPQLAEVLATWAERDAAAQPARALYLARRARSADPSQDRAARVDDDLSHNHRVWPGRLAIVAGIAAFVAGIYLHERVGQIEDDLRMHPRPGNEVDAALAQRDRYDAIGTGLIIAAPAVSLGGVLFTLSGQPSYTPTSPAELPALEVSK
jgi:hypothetical protein